MLPQHLICVASADLGRSVWPLGCVPLHCLADVHPCRACAGSAAKAAQSAAFVPWRSLFKNHDSVAAEGLVLAWQSQCCHAMQSMHAMLGQPCGLFEQGCT